MQNPPCLLCLVLGTFTFRGSRKFPHENLSCHNLTPCGNFLGRKISLNFVGTLILLPSKYPFFVLFGTFTFCFIYCWSESTRSISPRLVNNLEIDVAQREKHTFIQLENTLIYSLKTHLYTAWKHTYIQLANTLIYSLKTHLYTAWKHAYIQLDNTLIYSLKTHQYIYN